jgi:hypothetical protein
MSTDLERLKAAVARVTSAGQGEPQWLGTAFYIGQGFVLTAAHVLDAAKAPVAGMGVQLAFEVVGHLTDARLVAFDARADWALLRCDAPPPVAAIACGGALAADAGWTAFGYPGLVEQGARVVGTVRDPRGFEEPELPAIQLFCDDAAAGAGAPLAGLSGSPCMVDDRAVGILRSTAVSSALDGLGRTRVVTEAGLVWACPAAELAKTPLPADLGALPAGWFPQQRAGDFVVVRSRADQLAELQLLWVAREAHKKLRDAQLHEPLPLEAAAAVASEPALLDAVRWLCSATVVVFDATDFDAAVMLLLGIRAVVRRGVTILSIGGKYALGDRLRVPFNLMDANIVSHSERQSEERDERLQPVRLLKDRIERGLKALDSPHHFDLPVFEAVRRLPAERRGVRPRREGVLVLCSFEPKYIKKNWAAKLLPALKNQWDTLLTQEAAPEPVGERLGVARSFELNSPQMVSRAVYEEMRRAQCCVVDLTQWPDAVLFELGVRLAVSPHPTACLIERRAADAETDPVRQGLLRMLVPDELRYSLEPHYLNEPAFGRAYGPDAALSHVGVTGGAVFRCVAQALDVDAEPAARPVYRELLDSAQLFARETRGGRTKPVSLYPGNSRLTALEEQAEFDRLLAVALYLAHRHGGAPPDEAARQALTVAVDRLNAAHLERVEQLPEPVQTLLKDPFAPPEQKEKKP